MPAELSAKVNADLIKERKSIRFDIEELAEWWNGGEKALGEKRQLESIFQNDPAYKDDIPLSYLSHQELYEDTIRKATATFTKMRKVAAENNETFPQYIERYTGLLESGILKSGSPFATHVSMFVPTILGQGTQEQQDKWLDRAANMKILGTYAQTELGHGTFVRGLETTATYDVKTQEFVLNSPTISAYKWWPGGLGHTSNYAVVIAQLYTKGVCHGVHTFMVQLRDENTWEPLPGIDVGDIGPKIGMKAVNNGYLGFKNVRIPRTNLLMKNSQVLEDGTYVKGRDSILTYGTMVYVRVMIIRLVTHLLATAATIGTRYSLVRHQSPIDPTKEEPQIIEHITQQQKVLPNIARTFAFKLAGEYIWQEYSKIMAELDSGNLNRLPEFHALTCCLKSVCTTDAATGIETLRLACGGHGFMEASNFPVIYGLTTAAVTYEGENTILLLQTARFLIKSWIKSLSGQPLTPTVAYLQKVGQISNPTWSSTVKGIITGLQIVAANKVRLAYEHIEKQKKQGVIHEIAVNEASIKLAAAGEAHCRAFLVESSFEMTKSIDQEVSSSLADVIRDIIELYAVEQALRSLGDLLRFAGLNESGVQELQNRLENLLAKVRKNAVGIVDGFDIPDAVTNSALGAYDGNVYERLFAEAKKSPLNKEPVNKSFNLYLKPFLKSPL